MVERALSAAGADTVFVSEILPGAADVGLLHRARQDRRILITEDYDFGALIFGERRAPPPGLIHLALTGMTKVERDAKFAAEIAHMLDIAPGNFVVFSRRAPRTRPPP